MSTGAARNLLPATVPHVDAAANSGRAALLVHAMAGDPARLYDATHDWLHQSYREPAMPRSYELVKTLRNKGFAAVISGSGPSVLVLGEMDDLAVLADISTPGFILRQARIGRWRLDRVAESNRVGKPRWPNVTQSRPQVLT